MNTFEALYSFLLMYVHEPHAAVSSVVFLVGSYLTESRGWNGSGHSDARHFGQLDERLDEMVERLQVSRRIVFYGREQEFTRLVGVCTCLCMHASLSVVRFLCTVLISHTVALKLHCW
jgi:hypothetical protein